MSDATDTTAALICTTFICSTVCIFILCISRCQMATNIAAEATKQEAIKAGYSQGEYDRWKAPGSLPFGGATEAKPTEKP